MERLTVLRFSFSSCTSQSSVDVVENPSKKSKLDPSSTIQEGADKEDRLRVKNSTNRFNISIQKPNNISIGVQRLIKSFKSFSQIFVYKEEEDDDEDDEDMEMEIGLPTDVKHVAHIGWDGSTTTTTKSNTTTLSNNGLKDCFLWENLNKEGTGHQNNDTSISLRQFELAMAAQANSNSNGHDATTTTTQPLGFGSLKKPILAPPTAC